MTAPRFDRVFLIVLDGVGCGALPDAERFGDAGAHTLAHTLAATGVRLPHLEALGLGNITPLPGVAPAARPAAHFGRMAEQSAGKDTMTGHWELMGLISTRPFATFPEGFPPELIAEFERRTGRGTLGNRPASGTAIIEELGEEHLRTGRLIVYTSADSVFQIAAHEDVVPLEELYAACRVARELCDAYGVARVIARPFTGRPGSFQRTAHRRDYPVPPPRPTVLVRLKEAGWDVIALGKISDIYAGTGIGESVPTVSNADGMRRLLEVAGRRFRGLAFVNLVDFDSKYGHRRDPEGFASALAEFDAWLPSLQAVLGPRDLLIVTADHGNDPTHAGTDHTREYVPLLVWYPGLAAGRDLGLRRTFADVGATVAANFSVPPPEAGRSFLEAI